MVARGLAGISAISMEFLLNGRSLESGKIVVQLNFSGTYDELTHDNDKIIRWGAHVGNLIICSFEGKLLLLISTENKGFIAAQSIKQ